MILAGTNCSDLRINFLIGELVHPLSHCLSMRPFKCQKCTRTAPQLELLLEGRFIDAG